ncbi:mycofactocin biosynthesis peptidyl-dipeptidase MftE [Flexivirga oryzae]|uniref:Creatinine amidohydrolase n=1 Tax=Flexivirga oryzae TaxID=1794944 RepID=A0A839N2H6_9MICO|nr:mycofactocin biosynthesis peptidyl-dipeptidase MftE [Flexivirga oryzae]MBB2891537.1 creatinine amidohydrolase [Flexivirga oryzae]
MSSGGAERESVAKPTALGDTTSGDATGARVLLVPLGSVEQHGPHLPLSTDSVIARAVCERVADSLATHGSSAAVAPCVEFGSSGEHEGFDGTISIGQDALELVVVELVRSARRWARRIVLVSGHGGNASALRRAVRLLRHEEPVVAWTTCAEPGFDAHAGHAETSMMLALAPASVRLDRAEVGNTAPAAELWRALRNGGVAAVAPNGVLGDPRSASADEGERMLTALGRRISEQVLLMDDPGGVDANGALARETLSA